MTKILRYFPWAVILLALFACGIYNPTATATLDRAASGDVSPVRLTKQALNASSVFTIGQVINYSYVVSNAGSAPLAGPVTVTDDKVGVACPNVNTVGNLNNDLDPNESITCTSAYAITQADINACSVTNKATARAGGIDSSQATTTVRLCENKVLTITVTANPTTYSQAGQMVTYTYVVKNTGAPTLGPTQFVVTDTRFSTPINCGPQGAILLTNEAVSCTANYLISQADMSATQITNSATAFGGGAVTIQPASIAITNTNPPGGSGVPSTNLVKGSTIQHQVVANEWLWQIARCYGADPKAVIAANPQIPNPHWILPAMIVTVPNIGSRGTIYGPKDCVVLYTVQPGDTWNSIAQKYNADVDVLQLANRNITFATGVKIKVPNNSKGGPTPVPDTSKIRITIPVGSTSVSVQGSVNPNQTIHYVLNANQGQMLTIKLTAPVNEVGFTVTSPANVVLKGLDANLTWTGTILVSGDHPIDVSSILGASAKLYTLEVNLVSPTGFERVTDINGGAGDSNPAYPTVYNGILFFRADGNDGAGGELWKYDGNLKAASRVADINVGATGSEPAFLTAYTDGLLYFRANGNDGAGTELWRYNGNATGRLTDIFPGGGDSNPAYLAVFNNELCFSANGNDGAGVELWKTNGATYSRVTDIHAGSGDANPSYPAVFNNALYFSAVSNDGAGVELWKYDGTTAVRMTDIFSGVGNANPAYLTVFNGALYFSANGNDGAGVELWKYDGTTASRVADIHAGAGDSAPTFLTVFKGALYFGANGNDGTGFELWKYDGASATRVSDLNKSGDTNPAHLVVYNNELYFQANGGDGAGRELWKYKGQ
jgi:ELWxxDGT repeat protein